MKYYIICSCIRIKGTRGQEPFNCSFGVKCRGDTSWWVLKVFVRILQSTQQPDRIGRLLQCIE